MNKLFYYIKPYIPRSIQIILRRYIAKRKRKSCSLRWPIDYSAGRVPERWSSWPGKKSFSLVLKHDVETAVGLEKCKELLEIDKQLGFRSSFNFVPERYNVSPDLRKFIVKNGFEVAVHGLKHDGKLFRSKKIFKQRALRINHYLKDWEAVGFHSPSMLRNLDWIHNLSIKYDQSTFDTDPFEPEPEGIRSIFPCWINGKPSGKGYVEMPYTLPQDFTIFIILKEKNISIWKEKVDWIAEKGGMVLLNTHPDYMKFSSKKIGKLEYSIEFYIEFLEHLKAKYKDKYWHVLPKEMADFWSLKKYNCING